jgi:hypothetical protein
MLSFSRDVSGTFLERLRYDLAVNMVARDEVI